MLKVVSTTVISLILFAGITSATERTSSRPDWSGVWLNVTGNFSNPGSFKPITTVGSNPPPLNAEYDKKWKTSLAAAQQGEPINDPTANCEWPGTPFIIMSTMPLEFIIQPDRVVILYEWMSQVRRIYTDGRKVPEELDPSYGGFSTGHWEGDTLVVDTVGLRGDTVIEPSGLEHTDQLTVHERIRKVAPDLIETEVTMTDPGAFTKPWKASIQYHRQAPDFRILEYPCTENNRNGVGADGITYTLGPDGKPLEEKKW